MPIPQDFQFSQANLQDFQDCRRRFQLRYLQRQAWPAVASEPALENERYQRLGERFHRLAHQSLLGVPATRLEAGLDDSQLARWWQNYSAHVGELLASAAALHPEITLSAPLGDFRLLAKYDLLAVYPDGRVRIVDWKTYRFRPKRIWLSQRMQTRVYPYLLVQAGSFINSRKPIRPEQVEMVYWFAEFPTRPETFAYSERQFRRDASDLASLVKIIHEMEEADFPLTDDFRLCQYCVYRSLCDRGVKAGVLPAEGEDQEPGMSGDFSEVGLPLDFEQLPEVEF